MSNPIRKLENKMSNLSSISNLSVSDLKQAVIQVKAKLMGAEGIHGCLRPNLSRALRNETSQVRIGGAKGTKYYCHVIMLQAREQCPLMEDPQASHRCNNPWCANADHLCWESGEVNRSRICCRLFKGVVDDYICPHEPTCL